jgi:iron complex outermembrane receptor protein
MHNLKIGPSIRLIILVVISFQVNFYCQTEKDTSSSSIESILNTEVINTEKYVKSASRYSQSVSDAPSSISIITSDEIQLYGYQSLSQLVNSQRGFYLTNDRNYDYIGVRGFGRPQDYNNRILLLIDGHRINDYVYDGALIGNELGLDLNAFDRVEIVRGPGSALYGTSAMFGVINLIPKKDESVGLPVLTARYGSFNTGSFSLNFCKSPIEDLSFSLNANYYDSKGQDLYYPEYVSDNSDGIARSLDFEKSFGFMSSVKYKNLEIFGISTRREKGIPTAAYDADFNRKAETVDKQQFIEARFLQNISFDAQLLLRAYYDHYNYWGLTPYSQDDTISYNYFENNDPKTYGGEVQLIWDIFSSNRITTGCEYKNNYFANFRSWDELGNSVNFDAPYKVLSFYIQDEYQLNNQLSLILGLRSDNYINYDNAINPRFGIIYSPFRNHAFKLLYGTAFRAPNIFERFYNDSINEDPPFVRNLSLKSEKIRTTEFVWDFKPDNTINGSVSLYYYEVNGLIDVAVDSVQYFNNTDKITATGAEFEINSRPIKDLNFYFRYSYQYVKDVTKNEKLTNSPEDLLKVGLAYKFFDLFTAAFEYQFESARLTLNPAFVYRTEANNLASMNFQSVPVMKHFKFGLLIKNVFNNTVNYPGGVGHYQSVIPQNGRNFMLSVNYLL